MGAVINTAKVKEWRTLHFQSPEDILAEAERLGHCQQLRTLGNWSAGQIFQHLANTMNHSIDGFSAPILPAILRPVARLFLKRRFITKPMAPGFKLPAGAQKELGPVAVSDQEGLESLRSAIRRLQTESQRAGHPAFGSMTREEWDQIHCRHSEMHMSFLVPQ